MIGQEVGFTVTHEYNDNLGMTGNRFRTSDRRTLLKSDVAGNLVFMPTAAEALTILGTILTGASLTLATTRNPFDIVVDYGVGSTNTVKTYAACDCNALEISSEESQPVKFTMEVLGTTEATGGGVGAATDAPPYIDDQVTWDFNGNTYFPRSWSLRITRNFSETFAQSITRSDVTDGVFEVTGTANFDINSDIWEDIQELQGSNSNDDHVLTINDGTNSLAFTFPEIVFPGARPTPPSGEDGSAMFQSEIAWTAYEPFGGSIMTLVELP